MKKLWFALLTCSSVHLAMAALPIPTPPTPEPLSSAILAKIEKNTEVIMNATIPMPLILNNGLLPQNSQQGAEFAGELVATSAYQTAEDNQTAINSIPLVNQFAGLPSKSASLDLSQIFAPPTVYCNSQGNCYSTLSSLALFGPTTYDSSGAQTTAMAFLMSASGAGFALEPPPQAWYASSNADILQYIAYYKAISAAHSVAINDFANALASRSPIGSDVKNDSPRSHNTNLSFSLFLSQAFQDAFAKLPVLGRLYSIDEKMSGLLIALHQINTTLEKINASLDALNTIQTIQTQALVGNNLYQQAQKSQTQSSQSTTDMQYFQKE